MVVDIRSILEICHKKPQFSMIIQNVLIQIIQKTPLQTFIGSFQSQEILASKNPQWSKKMRIYCKMRIYGRGFPKWKIETGNVVEGLHPCPHSPTLSAIPPPPLLLHLCPTLRCSIAYAPSPANVPSPTTNAMGCTGTACGPDIACRS